MRTVRLVNGGNEEYEEDEKSKTDDKRPAFRSPGKRPEKEPKVKYMTADKEFRSAVFMPDELIGEFRVFGGFGE